MKRIATIAGAFALGISLLTACGDDGGPGAGGGGDYCDQLKDAQEAVGGAENGEFGDLDEAADLMKDLRDSAPDELRDDWDTLLEGFEAILQAFEDAGIDEEDLEAIQKGEIPPDLDMGAFQEAASQLQALDGEEFKTASDNIAKHAKEECDLDFNV